MADGLVIWWPAIRINLQCLRVTKFLIEDGKGFLSRHLPTDRMSLVRHLTFPKRLLFLCLPCGIHMQGLKVLIVEDDGDMRGLYCFLLTSEGYQVRAARNGLQAITEMQANRPDIVVTDIAMPVFSGLELIRAIRAHHDFADLPVLAVTAFTENFRERALEAGADEAIEKPTDVAELCGAIHRVASRSQPQALGE